ncbi:MAG: hypothetical protein KDA96_15785 [Planctomycetaceae bacterium]|nr:hypothetical protein [Planctomycetaceae bacterium]
MKRNRPALLGFGLSVLQLFLHSVMLGLTSWLAETGRAETLDRNSFWSWTVVGLLIAGCAATISALVVCLFWGLRKPPRVLALFGLAISFFSGTTIVVLVIMMALRSMSGG